MGWASGSILMTEIIRSVKTNVPDISIRQKMYKPMIESFFQQDWDTEHEVIGEDDAFDFAMNEIMEKMYGANT